MKKIIGLFYLLILIFPGLSAFAQKYKTMEDTIKLNKEYVNVSNNIAELNAKLASAHNNLPGYQSKERGAKNDAANAASASSDKASKATNGSISDAKTSKVKAKKAYNEAKDYEAAKNKVSNQEDKIIQYKLDIQKNQQRLEELDVMRAAIHARIPTDSISNMP